MLPLCLHYSLRTYSHHPSKTADQLNYPLQHRVFAFLAPFSAKVLETDVWRDADIFVYLTVVGPVDFIGQGQVPAIWQMALERVGKDALDRTEVRSRLPPWLTALAR